MLSKLFCFIYSTPLLSNEDPKRQIVEGDKLQFEETCCNSTPEAKQAFACWIPGKKHTCISHTCSQSPLEEGRGTWLHLWKKYVFNTGAQRTSTCEEIIRWSMILHNSRMPLLPLLLNWPQPTSKHKNYRHSFQLWEWKRPPGRFQPRHFWKLKTGRTPGEKYKETIRAGSTMPEHRSMTDTSNGSLCIGAPWLKHQKAACTKAKDNCTLRVQHVQFTVPLQETTHSTARNQTICGTMTNKLLGTMLEQGTLLQSM